MLMHFLEGESVSKFALLWTRICSYKLEIICCRLVDIIFAFWVVWEHS